MRKQLSTYGILLLTVMVIVRAATLESDQEIDLTGIFFRGSEVSYSDENLDFRAEFKGPNTEPTMLATVGTLNILDNVKANFIQNEPVAFNSHETAHVPSGDEGLDLADIVVEIPEDLKLDNMEEEKALSLEQESTINSGLSLLFPRQRIHSRSDYSDLEE